MLVPDQALNSAIRGPEFQGAAKVIPELDSGLIHNGRDQSYCSGESALPRDGLQDTLFAYVILFAGFFLSALFAGLCGEFVSRPTFAVKWPRYITGGLRRPFPTHFPEG